MDQADEEDVEEKKKERAVDLGAQNRPAVVFGSEPIPSFAPIIEC